MNNYSASVNQTISQREAKRGTKVFIARNGYKLNVTIPAGVQTGTKVRLTGALRLTDNVDGDLYVVIKIRDASGALLAFFGIAFVLIMAFVFMVKDKFPSTPPTQQASTKVYFDVPGKNSTVFTNGAVVLLINNPNATNPSYSQLMEFLRLDVTDQHDYSEFEYNCVDYAKDLHDRAEATGYRSALVGIGLKGKEVGHAVNAFETTDRGLVFVDVTSSGVIDFVPPTSPVKEENESWDKIAYLKLGSPYGVMNIDEAKGTTYEYYSGFKTTDCLLFSIELNQFTTDSDAFDAAYTDPNYSPEVINQWADRLNQWLDRLIAKSETINSCNYQSLGIVDTIKITW